MVDTFVFLTLARTGDQLQGIKKGVLELADIVVVNKADGEHLTEAKAAARELSGAIRLIYPRETLWRPPVLTMSALEGDRLDRAVGHRRAASRGADRSRRIRGAAARPSRSTGPGRWCATRCWTGCCPTRRCARSRADVERQVRDGELTPALAAQQIFGLAST